MAHNPAMTGNASMRQYAASRCNRQSKTANGALRGARSPASQALAARMSRGIALIALAALELSGDAVDEPVHAPKLHSRVVCDAARLP